MIHKAFHDGEAHTAALLTAGALGAAMSGSGPTAFGLFDRLEAAQEARACLAQSYRATFLCETV